MKRLLWRLQGIGATPHSPERFERGFLLHLEHADLLTILLQIGDQQQAYISATGCTGCHRGRHDLGCYVELLRRLLASTFAFDDLILIPLGLARRPYTRVLLAQPSKNSMPFDSIDLVPWHEARVIMHWRHGFQGLSAAAIVAVGEGPDPAALLQERGWIVRPLPAWIRPRIANSSTPASVWFRRTWPSAPFLFTPHLVEGW